MAIKFSPGNCCNQLCDSVTLLNWQPEHVDTSKLDELAKRYIASWIDGQKIRAKFLNRAIDFDLFSTGVIQALIDGFLGKTYNILDMFGKRYLVDLVDLKFFEPESDQERLYKWMGLLGLDESYIHSADNCQYTWGKWAHPFIQDRVGYYGTWIRYDSDRLKQLRELGGIYQKIRGYSGFYIHYMEVISDINNEYFRNKKYYKEFYIPLDADGIMQPSDEVKDYLWKSVVFNKDINDKRCIIINLRRGDCGAGYYNVENSTPYTLVNRYNLPSFSQDIYFNIFDNKYAEYAGGDSIPLTNNTKKFISNYYSSLDYGIRSKYYKYVRAIYYYRDYNYYVGYISSIIGGSYANIVRPVIGDTAASYSMYVDLLTYNHAEQYINFFSFLAWWYWYDDYGFNYNSNSDNFEYYVYTTRLNPTLKTYRSSYSPGNYLLDTSYITEPNLIYSDTYFNWINSYLEDVYYAFISSAQILQNNYKYYSYYRFYTADNSYEAFYNASRRNYDYNYGGNSINTFGEQWKYFYDDLGDMKRYQYFAGIGKDDYYRKYKLYNNWYYYRGDETESLSTPGIQHGYRYYWRYYGYYWNYYARNATSIMSGITYVRANVNMYTNLYYYYKDYFRYYTNYTDNYTLDKNQLRLNNLLSIAGNIYKSEEKQSVLIEANRKIGDRNSPIVMTDKNIKSIAKYSYLNIDIYSNNLYDRYYDYRHSLGYIDKIYTGQHLFSSERNYYLVYQYNFMDAYDYSDYIDHIYYYNWGRVFNQFYTLSVNSSYYSSLAYFYNYRRYKSYNDRHYSYYNYYGYYGSYYSNLYSKLTFNEMSSENSLEDNLYSYTEDIMTEDEDGNVTVASTTIDTSIATLSGNMYTSSTYLNGIKTVDDMCYDDGAGYILDCYYWKSFGSGWNYNGLQPGNIYRISMLGLEQTLGELVNGLFKVNFKSTPPFYTDKDDKGRSVYRLHIPFTLSSDSMLSGDIIEIPFSNDIYSPYENGFDTIQGFTIDFLLKKYFSDIPVGVQHGIVYKAEVPSCVLQLFEAIYSAVKDMKCTVPVYVYRYKDRDTSLTTTDGSLSEDYYELIEKDSVDITAKEVIAVPYDSCIVNSTQYAPYKNYTSLGRYFKDTTYKYETYKNLVTISNYNDSKFVVNEDLQFVNTLGDTSVDMYYSSTQYVPVQLDYYIDYDNKKLYIIFLTGHVNCATLEAINPGYVVYKGSRINLKGNSIKEVSNFGKECLEKIESMVNSLPTDDNGNTFTEINLSGSSFGFNTWDGLTAVYNNDDTFKGLAFLKQYKNGLTVLDNYPDTQIMNQQTDLEYKTRATVKCNTPYRHNIRKLDESEYDSQSYDIGLTFDEYTLNKGVSEVCTYMKRLKCRISADGKRRDCKPDFNGTDLDNPGAPIIECKCMDRDYNNMSPLETISVFTVQAGVLYIQYTVEATDEEYAKLTINVISTYDSDGIVYSLWSDDKVVATASITNYDEFVISDLTIDNSYLLQIKATKNGNVIESSLYEYEFTARDKETNIDENETETEVEERSRPRLLVNSLYCRPDCCSYFIPQPMNNWRNSVCGKLTFLNPIYLTYGEASEAAYADILDSDGFYWYYGSDRKKHLFDYKSKL